jgi:repressor of nif and glnA expression
MARDDGVDVAIPESLFWMQEVQKRGADLSRARVRFRNRTIDEYELARYVRAFHYAVRKYTDPLGRKNRG